MWRKENVKSATRCNGRHYNGIDRASPVAVWASSRRRRGAWGNFHFGPMRLQVCPHQNRFAVLTLP